MLLGSRLYNKTGPSLNSYPALAGFILRCDCLSGTDSTNQYVSEYSVSSVEVVDACIWQRECQSRIGMVLRIAHSLQQRISATLCIDCAESSIGSRTGSRGSHFAPLRSYCNSSALATVPDEARVEGATVCESTGDVIASGIAAQDLTCGSLIEMSAIALLKLSLLSLQSVCAESLYIDQDVRHRTHAC